MEIVTAMKIMKLIRQNSLLSLIIINNTFQKQKAELLFCKPFKVQNKYKFKTTLEFFFFQNKKTLNFFTLKK